MNLPFESFVAFRYLIARRKQAFISLISFISGLGVMVGVMALLIALALMTGLQAELRDRLVGSTAHVYVFKAARGGLANYDAEVAKLMRVPHVLGAAPAVIGKALMTSARGEQVPVTIKGIDPAAEGSVTDVQKSMIAGSLDALRTGPGAPDGIILGKEVATALGVNVGDGVSVFTPAGTLSPMGVMPRIRTLRVVGVFGLGLYEFDSEYAYVALPVAERLFEKSRPDFVQLRLDDMYRARAVAQSIPRLLGSEYMTQDWADMNKSLFSALWLEKMAISITIGLIVMVAALNIIASLVLLVMEKSRDIAILKTMGSPAASIRNIFMLQGLIIGLAGTAAGALFGCTIIGVLDRYKLIRVPVDVYQISYVPFTLLPLDFAAVIVAAILICFVATIYPSRQAAKLDPAQALRYQ
jgi:lipoprotein-releasing system permease protein